MINRFAEYCQENKVTFPPTDTSVVADFLCTVSDKSSRPSSVLGTASAAIGHIYKGMQLPNVMDSPELQMLITGLIKSGTSVPMNRSKVMPVQSFHDLFLSWPDNSLLSVKDLRLKAITLLAMTLMLRPSDAAPKGVVYTDKGVEKLVFSTDQVDFHETSATFTLFGIKNDTARKGFQVTIPRGNIVKIDPICTLQDYISRTSRNRGQHGPVFMSLKAPFAALGASSVARILDESISMAGLAGQGYSAKSFRPTGATCAIEGKIEPETVRKVGRWKNAEVFFSHYVHSRTPDGFTDSILSHK